MDIFFQSNGFKKECGDTKRLRRAHGERRAKLIRRRLDALAAAVVLEDLRHAAGRLHELTSNRRGQLSFDLDHPYRLIMVPGQEPVPRRPDGGMDWSQITAVIILGIEDTHE